MRRFSRPIATLFTGCSNILILAILVVIFLAWLESENGIYWINGKAGSGKSTLMRYIYDNSKTRQALTEWACRTSLSVAGFFFWNSGTVQQRSQCGLLRSLLFKVLEEHRDLISVVLPWLWARRYSVALDPSGHYERDQLSPTKLMRAFATLVEQTHASMKLCVFIDGLDEYDGDHKKIAEFFITLSNSVNIKICISSRPLLVFEDAFSTCPNLKLQDLTFSDIESYVHNQLTTHSRYQRLTLDEPRRAPSLEREIVTRADGVFLWVRLVVDSLLSGLGNRDDIIDLERRLQALPSDLERLYHHMLMNCIDPFYIDRASMMFQIVQIGSLDAPLSILSFAFTDTSHTDRPINEIIRPWTANEISIACQNMEDRMKVRCAGLLEVSGSVATLHGIRSPKANGKVQFLHRTVKDYLEKHHVWNLVLSKTSNPDFSPEISLLRSYILHLKTVPPGQEITRKVDDNQNLWQLATIAMQYASKSNLSSSRNHMALLEQLKLVIAAHKKDRPLSYPNSWSPSFLTLAVQHNLCHYVDKRLSANITSETIRRSLISSGSPFILAPLDYAVRGTVLSTTFKHKNNKEMIEILLRHGTMVSAPKPSLDNAWQAVLETLHRNSSDGCITTDQFPVILLFLRYGANPDLVCKWKGLPAEVSAATIVQDALKACNPSESSEVLNLLARHQNLKRPKLSVMRRLSSWSSANSADMKT